MKFNPAKILNFFSQHLFGLGIALGVAILFLGFVWFVIPQYREAKELGGLNYTQKQNQLEADQAYSEKLKALRQDLNSIPQENIDRIALVIPKGKDVPGIFKQMEKFADAVNMSLMSVAVSDGGVITTASPSESVAAASGPQIRTLSIAVTLGGSLNYPRMKGFLSTLSKQAPILDLTSITYSPSTSAAPTSYSFSFRSYYFE
ncbi:hypothetical protein C4546_02565 [Candidatus Parcubacteria bacterium]|jgi:hypothetical protein|nr:MAG: hypothetical protein C4546_02565 [Candidatus Parcubacteria bacterium]